MKTSTIFMSVLVSIWVIPTTIFGQTVLINETFTGGSTPSGWSNTDSEGSGDIWTFNDPGNRNISAGNFSGGYAIVDSDHYGNSTKQKTKLITPSFDASTYTVVTLEYDYQYREWDGPEYCKVQVYDGSSWNTITTYTLGDENYSGANHVSVDITSDISSASNAKVRFYYKGDYDYWFALDNVKITGTSPVLVDNPRGPGGIGTNDGTSSLQVWYTPSNLRDAGGNVPTDGETVKTWLDGSGYNHNATNSGNATYQSGNSDLINGNPKLAAAYLNRQFKTSSNITAQTLIAVTDPKSRNSFEAVIGFNGDKGIRRPDSEDDTWQYAGGGDGVNNDTWSTNSGESCVNGSDPNEGEFENELHFIHQTRPSTYTNQFYIGGYYPGRTFTGDLSEVIVFDSELSLVETIILNNYLSAKYDIDLEENDYYKQDKSSRGNFDYNVAGIGKASDGTSHTNSQGTGIIKMNTPSGLGNNEYLFWGEDLANSTYGFTTSSTDYMQRQNSTWRVSKRNDLGTVTLSVAAADLDLSGKQDCATLRLIVSSSSSFASKTSYDFTLSEGIYTATNVSFSDNDYFTFEYQDLIVVDNVTFYNGSGANHKPNTSDACYKLLVKNNASGALALVENANVREIEIENGGSLKVNSEVHLTVTGDIINNGTFTLQESAALVQNTSGINNNSGSGTYIVTRAGNNSPYIYNIWSSPISSANITSVFTDANPCDVWVFDRFSQAWSHDFAPGFSTTCNGNPVTFSASDVISGGDGVMDVTGGYFVPGSATASKTFTGTVNNGDYLKPISITSLGNPGGTDWGDDDWNMLGNPYPSALSAAAFWMENAINHSRITDALYFWDEADTAGGYNQNSDYASWNLSGGVNSGNSIELPMGYVGSGQGFWVVGSANTNVVFNNSMRAPNNSQFFKQDLPEQHNAWISFTSPSAYQNNILVGFNATTTDTLDAGYDAHKLVGHAHVRFASYIADEEFVIQSIAPVAVNDSKVIGLVVTSDETGTHSFSGYKREKLPSNFKIYIRDKVLGIDFDLADGDYTVDLDANVKYDSRFELVFQHTMGQNDGSGAGNPDSTFTTGIEDQIKSDFLLTQNHNELVISNPNGLQGEIRIFDISGRLIWTKTGVEASTSQTVSWSSFTAGTYFITITQNEERLFITPVVKP